MDLDHRHRRSLLAVNAGLLANAMLAALKTTVGVAGNSPALLADGINSTSDTVYYVVVRVFVNLARKPPDAQHPYGHRQLETIAALVVGAFVVTTAVAIFWSSLSKAYELVVSPTGSAGAMQAALWIALATVALKIVLTVLTQRIGRETGNPAVSALASDHRNDVIAAAAVSLGIFLGRAGHPWVDPLAGAIVALVILHTGIEILRSSSADLMDTAPSRSMHEVISRVVLAVPGVQRLEETYARRFGPYLVINLTVAVDGAISVAEGDEIANRIDRALRDEIDLLRRVHIHYHPARPQPRGPAAPRAPDEKVGSRV